MQVIGGRMFHRWCKLVGRPNLHDDPFATDILRGKNGEELSGSWPNGRLAGPARSA